MLPGIMSKMSDRSLPASTLLTPKTDVVRITTTTPIVNIQPPFTGSSGILFLIPIAAFTWTNAGNIAIGGTSQVGRVVVMIYSRITGKWYPSYTGV